MYTRIFGPDLLDSSLMDAAIETRWLFVSMVILADEAGTGIVDIPITALARRVGMGIDQVRIALKDLLAPDPHSRSKKEDGRRIVQTSDDPDRGWEVVNWAAYKTIASEEVRRQQVREAVARHRAKGSGNQMKSLEITTKPSDSESDSESDSTSESRDRVAKRPKRTPFVKPTVEEIEAHLQKMIDKGRDEYRSIKALKFYAHYEAREWHFNGNVPMKNWRAALATWAYR
jgi:hypothetical protein